MYRVLVLPKQFLGKGYPGWFAIAFPAVVNAEIWNLALMPAIAHWKEIWKGYRYSGSEWVNEGIKDHGFGLGMI